MWSDVKFTIHLHVPISHFQNTFLCKISQTELTICNKYRKLYKYYSLQVILWFHVLISITIPDVKSMKILQHLQITRTLFHQQQMEWNVGQVCHMTKGKHVLCEEYAVLGHWVISALMFQTWIITTKSRKLKSVDLEKNQSCDVQNEEVNVKRLIGRPSELKTICQALSWFRLEFVKSYTQWLQHI